MLILLIAVSLTTMAIIFLPDYSRGVMDNMNTGSLTYARSRSCLSIENVESSGKVTVRNCGRTVLSDFDVFVDGALTGTLESSVDPMNSLEIFGTSLSIGKHLVYATADYAETPVVEFEVPGSIPPTHLVPPLYFNSSVNNTKAGQAAKFSLKWTDDYGLSGYIFQFCNGTWNGAQCQGSSITTWTQTSQSDWDAGTETNVTHDSNNVYMENESYGSGANWANFGFDKCMNITIKNAGLTTLTNYPAYISLNKDGDMLLNYYDLRFYDSSCSNSGNLLSYEIENYTATKAHVWIKIPSLPSAGKTISVYYKNNTPVSSGQDVTGVWDANYKGVWHLGEGRGTTSNDSTTNGNNGTLISTAWRNGAVGNALGFDGINSRDNLGVRPGLHMTSALTVEAWINASITGDTYQRIFYHSELGVDPWGEYGISLEKDSGASIRWEMNTGGSLTYFDATASIAANTLYYVTGVYDGTNMILYMNGKQNNSAAKTGTIKDYNNQSDIGYGAADGYARWNGILDEVRVSNVARSANWINQSYQMIKNQNIFVTMGSEQDRPSGLSVYKLNGTFESQVKDMGQASTMKNITWSSSTPGGTSVCLRVAENSTGSWLWSSKDCASPLDLSAMNQARFVKFEAQLNTTTNKSTPVLNDATLTYTTSGGGSWVSDPWMPMTGLGNWSNVTKILNSTVDANVAWCVHANDTDGNWNTSSCNNPFTLVTTTTSQQPPLYFNSSTNNTVAGRATLFSLNWTDDAGLSGYIFSTNNTGRWTNSTWKSFTGVQNTSLNITALNTTVDSLVQWCVYANDTSNNWNATSCASPFSLITTSQQPPQYYGNSTNNTLVGQPTKFSLNWTDDIYLSGYIFSTNNTGSWKNATWIAFTGIQNTSWNITTLNSTAGSLVQWCFYANDTSGSWNGTSCAIPFILITASQSNAPKYFSNSTNDTVAGRATLFSLNWTSTTGLSGYVFSTNNTGTWQNETWRNFENRTGDALNITGFELGTIEKWKSGSYWGGGNPAIVQSAVSYMGYYSAKCILNSTGGNSQYCQIYTNYTAPKNTIYERFYVRFNATPPLGGRLLIGPEVVSSDASYDIEGVYIINDGALKWQLLYRDGGATPLINSLTPTVTANTWYYVEIEYKRGSGNGEAKLWIAPAGTSISEGNPTLSVTGLTNDDVYATYLDFGPWASNFAFKYEQYMDNIAVSSSYIGPYNSWSNVTKTLNSTTDSLVQWCVYANDTDGNWNATSCANPFSLTTTGSSVKTNPILFLKNGTTSVGTSGLVGYWKFDEGVGSTAFDSSGNKSGTIYGNPTWVDARFGSALNFNGYEDYVDVGNDPVINVNSEVSVSAWIIASSYSSGSYERVIEKGLWTPQGERGSYRFVRDIDVPQFAFQVYDTSSVAQSCGFMNWQDLTIGRLYHLVGTYTPTEIRCYVDGVLTDSNTDSFGNIQQTADPLVIGANSWGTENFNGIIDEVMIWNRALSAGEVRELFKSSVAFGTKTNFSLSETNANDADVSYDFYRNGTVSGIWRFDEGAGSYAFDETGNDNAGTLGNGTANSVPAWTASCKYGQCLSFDAGDSVIAPDSSNLELSNVGTVELWAKKSENARQQGLAVKSGSYYMNFEANNSLRAHLYSSGVAYDTYSDAITDFNWHHYVLAWNASRAVNNRVFIYIDGVLEKTGNVGGNVDVNGLSVYIGSYYDTPGNYFRGTIDEVKIYPRFLTASEVLCRYANNCSQAGLWNDTATLAKGYYYYTASTNGGQNYMSSSLRLPLNVT
jgi:hypothetical protein